MTEYCGWHDGPDADDVREAEARILVCVGAKVIIEKPWAMDEAMGVKLKDTAKITFVGLEDGWVFCFNPHWRGSGSVKFALSQIKVIQKPEK